MHRSEPRELLTAEGEYQAWLDARDVRTGGAWTRSQRIKNDLIYAAARLGLWAAAAIPRSWVVRAGPAIGAVAWAMWPQGRRATAKNLEIARRSMKLSEQAAIEWPTPREVFEGLGEMLADMLLMLRADESPSSRLHLDATSRSTLESALIAGRGVVFITAHLGPWERMAALLAAEGFPISTVARESYDPRLNFVYDRLRTNRGVHALYRGASGFSTALVRALRQGRIVGFPMDLPGRFANERVLWFGVPRATASGPATIAIRTRAIVVVGTPRRNPSGQLDIDIRAIDTDSYTLPEGPRELTQRLASELQSRVLSFPHAWPWMSAALEDCPRESRPVDSRPAL